MGLSLHFVCLRRGRRGWQLTLGAVLFAQGSLAAVLKALFLVVVSPVTASHRPALVASSALLMVLDGAIVAPFFAGAHQRSSWSMLGWCLSFYLVLLVIGASLVLAFSAAMESG